MSIDKRNVAGFQYSIKYPIKGQVGVDEVGRGCVAGPVVAAAVAWNPNNDAKLITLADSKKLTPLQRTFFDNVIKKVTLYGIGVVDVVNINKLNILHASLLAMRLAIENLREKCSTFTPTIIVVDGDYEIPDIKEAQIAQPKADEKVPSVMAASIIAKVYRDTQMIAYHKQYPNYGWDSNKGYCTEKHVEAIKKYGLTPLHRNYKKFLEKIGVEYGE